MQVKIIFDKDAQDPRLHTGWGVSCLIDDKILFDTGENGQWLIENLERLAVDTHKLESVVISHDHWDHQGGLWKILEAKPNIKVYACPNFSRGFKEKVKSLGGRLIEIDKFTQIEEGIYSTGEIAGRYAFRYMPEQALALKSSKGVTVLTGCAHPGITKIIENIKNNISEDIYLVLGGFHLMAKSSKAIKQIIEDFRKIGVKMAAPTHCSGEKAIGLFKQEYGDKFIKVEVGRYVEV